MDLLGIGKINKKQMIKVIIILFAIVWFFPTLFFFVLNGHISIEEGNEEKKIKVYNIFELYQTVSEEIIYTIELTTKEVCPQMCHFLPEFFRVPGSILTL